MKSFVVSYIFVAIGGTIGAFVPVLFGASPLGGWSIFCSMVGGIVGIIYYRRTAD